MLEFGSPYTQNRLFIPPVQVYKTIIPTDSVRTLNSIPFTILPGIPGLIITPESGFLVKQAGTAYGLGASTNVQIQTSTGAAISTATATSGLFNSDLLGTATFVYFLGNFYVPADNLVGIGLRLAMAGGDLTGGIGDVYVYLQFRAWPVGTNLS